MKKQYKLLTVSEPALQTVLLSKGKLPVQRIEDLLNHWSKDGWEFDFMALEKRRLFLFWIREAAIITLSKQG